MGTVSHAKLLRSIESGLGLSSLDLKVDLAVGPNVHTNAISSIETTAQDPRQLHVVDRMPASRNFRSDGD